MTRLRSQTDCFTLANATPIPCLAFGTWQVPADRAEEAVAGALALGYRHIDAAAVYANEVGVGRGIAASGLAREEIFVTGKVWNTERGYDRTMAAFEKSLADLGLDYLDLYLIHWPASASRFADWETINLETWRAMTELHEAGRIRAIGVSNFLPHHLEALMGTRVAPMVNQIEFHPGFLQEETVAFCRAHNILVEAWSPLGSGRVLDHPLLKAVAARHGKSTAQICLAFCLQEGVLPLPKSVTPARQAENLTVFDITLSDEDMAAIRAMPQCGESGLHPDKVDF